MNSLSRYGIAALVVVFDQITKVWVDRSLQLYEQIPVTPMFNITLAYNRGAAFSFLSDEGGWQRWFFIGISVVVSVCLTVWLYRMKPNEKWLALAIALILGGAIGNNLIDRVIYGHVVDFIQVYYDTWYFPSFNIADSAITVGTVLLLILTFFEKDEQAKSESKNS
jgi:signal peptidase II